MLAATSHEVTCIQKQNHDDPCRQILRIGGPNADRTDWQLYTEDAIDAIEAKKWHFWVRVEGKIDQIIVAINPHGRKYLKASKDGESPDSLLGLPECP